MLNFGVVVFVSETKLNNVSENQTFPVQFNEILIYDVARHNWCQTYSHYVYVLEML